MVLLAKAGLFKKCGGPCGKSLPVEQFSKMEASPDGLQRVCKKCDKERKAEYRARPEVKAHVKEYLVEYMARPGINTHIKEWQAEYRVRPEIKAREKERWIKYSADPEYRAEKAKYHEDRRELCLDEYGHRCIWPECDIVWSEFLAFDHPNNDGKKHREEIGTNIVGWLIENNFPKIVQLLCHNHNAFKEIERGRLILSQTPSAIAGRKSDAKLKLETFTEYSPNKILGCSCPGCNISDINLLTTDHIHGIIDSTIPRTGMPLYRYLRKNGFPPGYQTLCFNCNKSRGSYGGYCPHQGEIGAQLR